MSLLFYQSALAYRGSTSNVKNAKLQSDLCKYSLQGSIFVYKAWPGHWWNVLFHSEQANITLVKCGSCVKSYQQTVCRFRSYELTINHWSWKAVPRVFWNLNLNGSKLFNLKLVWDFWIVKGTFFILSPVENNLSHSSILLSKRRKNRYFRQNQIRILLHQTLWTGLQFSKKLPLSHYWNRFSCFLFSLFFGQMECLLQWHSFGEIGKVVILTSM